MSPADGPAADAGMREAQARYLAQHLLHMDYDGMRPDSIRPRGFELVAYSARGGARWQGGQADLLAIVDALSALAQPAAPPPPEADVAGDGEIVSKLRELVGYLPYSDDDATGMADWMDQAGESIASAVSALEALQAKLEEADERIRALSSDVEEWQRVGKDALRSDGITAAENEALAAEVERLKERVEQAAEDGGDLAYKRVKDVQTAMRFNYTKVFSSIFEHLERNGAMSPAARATARAAKGGA